MSEYLKIKEKNHQSQIAQWKELLGRVPEICGSNKGHSLLPVLTWFVVDLHAIWYIYVTDCMQCVEHMVQWSKVLGQ